MMAVDSLDGGMWEPPSWGSVVRGSGSQQVTNLRTNMYNYFLKTEFL
jgi:hypothetical protein